MRFKSVLKKYKLTQNDLAERLNINRVSVCRLLADDNDIRLSTIVKIAHAVGCSPAELIDDTVVETTDDSNTNTVALTCPHCHKSIRLSIQSDGND